LNINIQIIILEDLNKLKDLIDHNHLKVNVFLIAKELGKDRRTVKKYIHDYVKNNTRNKKS